jgi:uncharacterized repeat protein (TIGR02543 family)
MPTLADRIKISISHAVIFPAVLCLMFFTGCGGGGSNKGGGGTETRTYNVTFFSNGGSSVPARQVQHGGTLTEPAQPTRAEYAFEGWHRDPALTNKVTFPITNITENISLYAKWRWTPGTEIFTPAELNNVRNNLSGNYRLAADISLSSYANWMPIGSEAYPFTGKFDGGDYRITGLKIDRKTAYHAGLFGYVSGGEITNITLENVDVAGGNYSGAIAGIMEGGAINGCSISGKITSVSSSIAFSSSGGVVGSLINDGEISGCRSAADVTAEDDAGGIAGSVYDGKIINSSSSGEIVAFLDSFIESSGMSGGIAGYAENSEITGCFSTGRVYSSAYVSQSGGIVGGLAHYSVISNSYSTGNIYSDSDSDIRGGSVAGGIAGYVLNGTITKSYSAGNITSSSVSGGIVGSSEGDDEITNCAAVGMTISAYDDAGRIAGYIFFPGSSTISGNFARADMTTPSGGVGFTNNAMNHGASRSDADLKRQDTYSGGPGWRFGGGDSAPWRISTGNYPFLYWQ